MPSSPARHIIVRCRRRTRIRDHGIRVSLAVAPDDRPDPAGRDWEQKVDRAS
jgi:hypothetical protein